MPSNDVMNRPVPLVPVAMNKDMSEAQVTDDQAIAKSTFCIVHVVPFGDVATRLVPSLETATNNEISGDQQTDCH